MVFPRVRAWRENGTWKSWALDTWKGSLRARPRARLPERVKVSSHFICFPYHTHSCLVLGIRSLPLNIWILSPSDLVLPPSQPYTQNLTHSWSPKTIR